MKKFLYILTIFSLTIVGCSDILERLHDYGENCIVLNIYNSPLTKAVDNAQGEEYERVIKRLDCFFYAKGATDKPCIFYQKVENLNEDKNAQIPFYVDESLITTIFGGGNTCEVFVIANLSSEIIGNTEFESGQEGTEVTKLSQIKLLRENGNYDAIDKPFVMAGLAECTKDSRNNAQAEVTLVRAAAKIKFSVVIPESIVVTETTTTPEGEVTNSVERIMYPALTEESIKVTLHNGAKKGYLNDTYTLQNEDLYVSDKLNFEYVKKIPAVAASESNPVATPAKYVYTCETPLYTYARSWAKGDPKAAYWTFEMQWGYDSDNDRVVDSYRPYYYQILINGGGRSFEPNHWYDMTVSVGILGSTIEALPEVLEELSYYVIDWTQETFGTNGSGDRLENVHMGNYKYLEVPETYIEMDNINTVNIHYSASHKIGVKFDTKGGKSVVGLSGTTNYSALYISNYNTTTQSGTPEAKELPNISLGNFTDNNKGWLTFNYKLNSDIYSPAYVFITIWLDIDGDGVHDSDEIMTQDIKIVMYPAIYILGDNSAEKSIFVNGNYGQAASKTDYLTIDGKQVGKAVGQDASTYMHIISISAFNENNYQFAYNSNNTKDTEYIIGDPRVRSSNKLGVPDDDATVKKNATGWIKATDINRTVRNLEYYYPTSTETNSYQVIAPKFRIASKLGGYSECHPQGAALRCASYQEHGFPAGRWRLPTTAEVLFIVELQKQKKIKVLFYGGNTYFSATDRLKVNDDNSYTLSTGLGNSNASVRCVYDEWYWGSEREAIANSNLSDYGGYQFTWGDRRIY